MVYQAPHDIFEDFTPLGLQSRINRWTTVYAALPFFLNLVGFGD